MRKFAMPLLVAALAVSACSTSKPGEDAESTTAAPASDVAPETTVAAEAVETTAATTDPAADTTAPPGTDAPVSKFPPVVDDRAPGVTDTAVKIGIIYLDLSSAGPILGINQGDYQAAYQAAIDAVNEAGGVHGRTLEAVFTPIVPASADQGTAACTKLTDDEGAFLVLGNYVDENAPCVVTTHETPLLGGDLAMTPESLGAAKALWYAVGGGTSGQTAGLQTLIDSGVLTGKVGVVGALGSESLYEQGAKPLLEAGGVDVVDVAYLDIVNGATDPNSLFAAAETVALKFESEGVDQIVFNSGAGQVFPAGLARTDYRPQLVFDTLGDASIYVNGVGNDLSVLENAVAAGAFDSENLFPELGGVTAECVESQEERLGVEILPSSAVPDGDPDYWASSRVACQLVGLAAALLDAAGPELNWGTFTTAAQNIGEVELAGAPDPFVFDKENPTGSPRLYTYTWDPASETMIRDEG